MGLSRLAERFHHCGRLGVQRHPYLFIYNGLPFPFNITSMTPPLAAGFVFSALIVTSSVAVSNCPLGVTPSGQ